MRAERAAALVAAAAFGLLTIVSALQLYISRVASNESATLLQVFSIGAATWLLWALFTPGILWLGRRFDFRRGRRAVSTAVHLLALILCHVPTSLFVTWLGFALFSPERVPTAATFRQALLLSSRLQLSVLLYLAILGLGYAARIWLALRERELTAVRLEAQSAQARLEALATRLQPHFIFNTLHTIGALIDEDPHLARAMLVQLGDLLRDLLADPGGIEVTLREELALLQRYLDIEQIRFADRLRTRIDASPDSLDALVPRLLLQPVVENALRHGLAPKAAGGTLRIQAEVSGKRLRLTVWNDGIPLKDAHREGIGLSTTRERLRTRHGDDGTLLVQSASDGVQATLELPVVRTS